MEARIAALRQLKYSCPNLLNFKGDTHDTVEKFTDGMISHENEELRDRVAALEKKVQQQEDEILVLKSALSDVIRRLSGVESSRGLQNNVLPSKPQFRTPKKPASSRDSPTMGRRAASVEHMSHKNTPIPNRIVPRLAPPGGSSSRGSLQKFPSTTDVPHQNSNGHISPTSKDTTFNQEEGYLRMYMRGRAVSLYAPSDFGDYDITKAGQAPTEKLKLDWVYGYRGRDCRSNLFLLPTGEIIYFAAAVVVLYNVEEQMQRHYLGHTDDVKCLALHPDKITIASGQMAGHGGKEGRGKQYSATRKRSDKMLQPHIRIWDSVSLNTLHILGVGDFERAIACVAFSKADGGQYLCAVDDANEHTISLWDWQKGEKGHKITETKSSTEPVLALEFHPCEKNIVVSCGKNQISFWTIDGGTLVKKLGIFEKYDKPKYMLCLAFADNGDVLSGDSNGNLLVWGRGTNRVSQAILGAHEGGVFSVSVMKDGTILTGGGKDRKIIQWTAEYKKAGPETELSEQYGPVRMLNQGKGNMIIVGTTRNAILQGTIDLNFSPIVQGHMDELWGLAPHPSQHQFLSCGYDKHVFMWDSLTHSVVWSKELPDGAHCVCIHPDGNVAVVGTQAARWLVLDLTTRDVISSHTDGNEQLECVQFSPDGKMLAIGSRDNYVYVYQVNEDGRKYSRIGRCSGHSSFITHLDWSTDGQFLQTNSGDYEVLFWSATTCRQVTQTTSMRDIEWATHTCTLGFNVAGIWPEGADGTDVNACSRSHKNKLVASADDFGKVNLYAYPCSQPKSAGHIYGGHSSHVTNVNFICDDSRLLSTGGKDMTVMQWEVL